MPSSDGVYAGRTGNAELLAVAGVTTLDVLAGIVTVVAVVVVVEDDDTLVATATCFPT
jgi:hypothetical protein